MVSKYLERVKLYTTLPKDIGFSLMEEIVAEMVKCHFDRSLITTACHIMMLI